MIAFSEVMSLGFVEAQALQTRIDQALWFSEVMSLGFVEATRALSASVGRLAGFPR